LPRPSLGRQGAWREARRGSRGHLDTLAVQGAAASAAVRSAKRQARAVDLAPVIAEVRAAGASSLREIAAALDARNIPAARGGRWNAGQVKRVLETAG
jgi:hypothetical protein